MATKCLQDVSHGLRDGEYPIYYYAHEARPPSVRKLSESFGTWLGEFCIDRDFQYDDDWWPNKSLQPIARRRAGFIEKPRVVLYCSPRVPEL